MPFEIFFFFLTINLSKAPSSPGNTKIISITAANAPMAMHCRIIIVVGLSIMKDIASGAIVIIVPEVTMVWVDDL